MYYSLYSTPEELNNHFKLLLILCLLFFSFHQVLVQIDNKIENLFECICLKKIKIKIKSVIKVKC
jgi:hypothetical protein